MKISNYLKQLEKKESEKITKASALSKGLTDEFIKLIRELEVIGNNILKLSKKAINDLVNNREDKAKISLIKVFNEVKVFDNDFLRLRKKFKIERLKIEQNDLRIINIDKLESCFLSAIEEYLEAKILFVYLRKGLIYRPKSELLENFRSYAGALCDFCGELVRRASADITKKEYSKEKIRKYRKDAENIGMELSGFSFSNKSGIRPKIEQLNRHIKNLDDMLYDLRDK